MKLTTDLAIKKWKPNSEGERTSCGQSLYVQGYSNGKRSWVYRLQIGTGSSKRSIWLTIGQPALGSEHGIAGGALRLAEARELAMRISGAVKRGETSADQVKRALDITEPPHLNWSTVIFRKRRTKNDKQTTKARRDCVEVTAS